ncbi:tetratricopeptide repeat protein [Nitratireductor aquimarinus]|uniref:tetratricopeptide repeat protein n=1 Tax=Nitratireductor aquimarinus TaxID=889300 RepID=UPI00398EE5B4
MDGHYWLQYGQYLSSMRLYDDALPVLEKSIQAYPENDFAAHALADVQLRVAKEAGSWSSTVAELVGHAVATLEELHANRSNKTDQYAIATLAKLHTGVLIKHNRTEAAKEVAKRYFNEIGDIKSVMRGDVLEETRKELLQFITTGELPADLSRQNSENGARKYKENRKHRRPKKS